MPSSPSQAAEHTGAEPLTVAQLGERALVERIRARVPAAPGTVLIGIGDDAAVIEPDRNALSVVTTDVLVEGIHFDLRFVTAADLGYKALAVNLSDLAAMGASPRVALLSLVLPPALRVASVDALLDGLLELAARHRTALVGGNISRSPGPLVVDVTAIGAVHRRRVLTRGGARAGDDLYVTGSVGGAAAGLALLQEGGAVDPEARECVRRYLRPEARVRFGTLLGRNRAATACIDLSDGLADGIRQIARASGTGAAIDASAVPIEPGARRWFESTGLPPVDAAMAAGEDYELLFAVRPRTGSRLTAVRRVTRDVPVTRIGRLAAGPALVLTDGRRERDLPDGFAHFS